MIKGILFAVFFILLAAGGALATIFGIKLYQHSSEIDEDLRDIKRKYQNKLSYGMAKEEVAAIEKDYANAVAEYKASHRSNAKPGLLVGICLAIASLGLVIAIPGSFHQVEAGTYAVVKKIGKIVDVRSPGTYFDFYMTKKYETYDATVQQAKINTSAYSKDGQTMDLEVYLQYQIQLDKLVLKDENGNILQTEGIAGKYVTLDSLQARIETQCIEKTKAVMSSAEAMTIIQDRAYYSDQVSTVVREAIGPDYYVNVQDVVLTNIDFTDEFEKSVEDKVVAEQQKQASITKAEAELEVAKIEANKKIEEARGNAEAEKIQKKAAAEAATYNITELARTLGYTVVETYIYSVNGVDTEFATKQAETDTVIFLGTEYVIDITSGPGADKFKSLVEDYLQYLAYLNVWDGKLPDVVAGDDAISIIVPNN